MNVHLDAEPVGLGRYVMWFAGTYIGVAILAELAIYLLGTQGIKNSSGMLGFMVLLLSANAASRVFLKKHKRLFVSGERWRMTVYSFLTVLILTAAGIALLVLTEQSGQLGSLGRLDHDAMIGLSIGGAVIAALVFGLLYLSYGHLMKVTFNGMQKRGEI